MDLEDLVAEHFSHFTQKLIMELFEKCLIDSVLLPKNDRERSVDQSSRPSMQIADFISDLINGTVEQGLYRSGAYCFSSTKELAM